MKALTWQGKRNVTVERVDDPVIEQPTDAIITVTSSAICGSDLHQYELLGPFIDRGDILGHEPMGTVVDVGAEVAELAVGDRVVIAFNIACGHCFMCRGGLQSQCETTQVREYGSGAALFGYAKLYGQIPGGQAEYLWVPLADYNHIDRSRAQRRDGVTQRRLCRGRRHPADEDDVRQAAEPAHGSVQRQTLGG
ncbi:threonine dehydrogenase-like Zn-dependent dehydrogenase [Microbacterium sp. AK031]|nr:threonine dehydrogenase-like Zn-dependent dehydrogenase [Microbacterium sp. AK031]